MKTPFLLFAALALAYSTHAFAEDAHPAQEPAVSVEVAKSRLADFKRAHPDVDTWNDEDLAKFAALRHTLAQAQAAAQPAPQPASQAVPLPPLHPQALAHPTHSAEPRVAPPRTEAQKRLDARKRKVESAWDKIEKAAAGLRDGIADAYDTISDAVQDGIINGSTQAHEINHERPLLFSQYVDVVKKGHQVSLVYCNSRLFNLNPNGGQHCEKLHQGSFSVAELRSCLKSAPEELRQPGMILNRQMDSLTADDRAYNVEHFKMFDSKENYAQYLSSCHARLTARRVTAQPVARANPIPRTPAAAPAAPVEQPAALPPLVFQPVNENNTVTPPNLDFSGTL